VAVRGTTVPPGWPETVTAAARPARRTRPARKAAGEGGCHRGPGAADGPAPGHPVDDDRRSRRGRRRAGEGEGAEHAAFHAAHPAGQRDEPPGQLPGDVGEQQASPGDRQPGQPETGSQHPASASRPVPVCATTPAAQAGPPPRPCHLSSQAGSESELATLSSPCGCRGCGRSPPGRARGRSAASRHHRRLGQGRSCSLSVQLARGSARDISHEIFLAFHIDFRPPEGRFWECPDRAAPAAGTGPQRRSAPRGFPSRARRCGPSLCQPRGSRAHNHRRCADA